MNNNKTSLPKFPYWLLKKINSHDYRESYIGDIEEEFRERTIEKGRKKAVLWIWYHSIVSIPWALKFFLTWRYIMFKNYLRIVLRILHKNKGYSIINITGLAIGIASCILIFLWVQKEKSYDRFHENLHEIFRVTRSERLTDGTVSQYAGTPRPLGPSFKEEYPEIIDFVRYYPYKMDRIVLEYNDNQFYANRFSFSDPSFFLIFTFPFLHGNRRTALSEPNSVVVTEQTAIKYFGVTNSIGKSLILKGWGHFIVSGIIKNIPDNSHIQFDFIAPISSLFKRFRWMKGWRIPHFYTYLLLNKKTEFSRLEEKIKHYIKKVDPEVYKSSNLQFSLQSLKDIHLHSSFRFDLEGHSELRAVYVNFFSIIAAVVLIIACFNFANLTAAHSGKRIKEICMRKVSGANRADIALQFLGELMFTAFISMVLALFLVFLFLPVFNTITGIDLNLSLVSNPVILLGILGITMLAWILSSIYPTIILSAFKPGRDLKGFKSSGSKRAFFRRIFVIIQFSLSLILIIGTVIIYKQLDYMQNKNLGYDKDYILYFAKQGKLIKQYQAFKAVMLKKSKILSVTASSDVPTKTRHLTFIDNWEGSAPEEKILMNFFSVDHDFIKSFGIEIVQGRNFSREFPSDMSEAYILNEEAVKQMGMESPVEKEFSLWNIKGYIIGVMRNFHFKSLHNKIEPLILLIKPEWDKYIFVRVSSEGIQESLQYIEWIHKQFNPGYPFEFIFLNEEINQLYRSEKRVKQIFQLFTSLAIFISCIGLFGMAAIMAEKRTKEIGIRKVLGSSVSGVVVLLSKDIIKWVTISMIAAWPLAFVVMNRWLQNFAYRTGLEIWIFIFPSIATICIALLTVSYHTIRAARTNPVESLKYE